MKRIDPDEFSKEIDKLINEGAITTGSVSLNENFNVTSKSLLIKETNINILLKSFPHLIGLDILKILFKNNAIVKGSTINLSIVEGGLFLNEVIFEVIKNSRIIDDLLNSSDDYACEVGLTIKELFKDSTLKGKQLFHLLTTPEGRRLALSFFENGDEEKVIFAQFRVNTEKIAKRAAFKASINRIKKIFIH